MVTFNFSATDMPPISNGDFTMSIKNTLTCGDDNTYLQLSINGSYSANHNCKFNTQNSAMSFHLSASEVITGFRIRISNNVTIPSGFKIYPMIEIGTKETEFVKYEVNSFTPSTANT